MHVLTGKDKDMGTEGPVWIRIMGKKDRKTGRQRLELIQKKEFAPSSKETFSFEAFDVEEVRQIEVIFKLIFGPTTKK